MKKVFYIIIGFTLFATACKKDINRFIPNPLDPVSFIHANISGGIIDENGNPVEGAKITIRTTQGAINLTTDQNGIFIARDVEVRQDLTYVTAELEGYFLGSRSIYVTENSINYLTIKLLDKKIIGEIPSNTGGTIQTPEGAIIKLPENGIIDNNGNFYEGTVQVSAKWLDPTAQDLGEIMPGNLLGIDTNNQPKVLATAGMMAVELIGNEGQELNIAPNAIATLEFPIPPNASNFHIPETIPLWYFDEAQGVWVEEGIANLVGDKYIGEVSHFSFWNCDAPYPLIEATGKLTDTNGNPIPNANIKITLQGTNAVGYGKTDGNGCFGGKLPKDEILTLEIADNCWNISYSEEIGPFSENVVLPTIEFDLNGVSTINVLGALVDCNADPVSNGYVNISTGYNSNFHLFVDANGDFDATVFNCNQDTISAKGFDIDNLKESPTVTLPANPIVDFGNLEACDVLSEYIEFTIYGVSYKALEPDGGVEATSVQIYNSNQSNPHANLSWIGDNVGDTYTIGFLNLITPDSSYSNSSTTVTLTQLGVQDEIMTGDFSGTVLSSTNTPTAVSGSFKVIRDF